METDCIYASLGGIRTYLHLLDCRDTIYMHLILIVLTAILEDG